MNTLTADHPMQRTPTLAVDDLVQTDSATGRPRSLDHQLGQLESLLSRVQFDSVAATVIRRRSLTDSLLAAMTAYWDTVEAHVPEHRAVRHLRAQRWETPGPDHDSGRVTTDGVADWLALIADVHLVQWELPVERLALLTSATLDGLTTDYLVTGDPAPAREVLRVLSYQIGRYGRRPSKNQQH